MRIVFSDVIVGAERYTSGQAGEGRAFVFLGSPAGLAAGPAWTAEGDQAGATFGSSVAPAGDVNGDGFSDVIVGATGLTPGTLYHWRLRIISGSAFFPRSPWLWLPGNSVTEADVRTARSLAAVAGAPPAAARVRLEPGSPNPFQLHAELRYDLPRAGRVRLDVIDVLGRRVTMLADAVEAAGRHAVLWDGRDARGRRLPAGTYFVRLESGGTAEIRKVVLAR